MKTSHIFLILSSLLLASMLAGCASGAGLVASWPGLTVNPEKNTAYVAFGNYIYAVSLENGAEKWRFPQSSKAPFYAAPALTEDGQLIAVGYDHQVYSVNPETGQQNWVFSDSKDRLIASPLAVGQKILVPSADFHLYAITLSGNLSWKFATNASLWAKPASDGQQVFLPAMDHSLYSLHLDTGSLIWRKDLGGAMAAPPVLGADGVLYLGTFGSEMYALKMQDGSQVWKMATSGWVWDEPALLDGVLYFGDASGTLYAVNAAEGTLRWKTQPDAAERRAIVGKPLVTQDTVYFGTEGGNFYAVDIMSGNQRWTKNLGGGIYSGPLQAGDKILVVLEKASSLLVALDANGNQVWGYVPAK
jgi:outer membrane protein assembly factor BamB